jgi:DNA-directed RNA polymerase omega subunit
MLSKPNVSELIDKADSRYEVALAVAKRARQISKTRLEVGDPDIKDAVDKAATEMEEGKVSIIKE